MKTHNDVKILKLVEKNNKMSCICVIYFFFGQ